MILKKVDFRTRRTVAPVAKAPDPVTEAPAGSGGDAPRGERGAIYSRKLKKKLSPYRDPKTGRISAVVTEDGDILTEADIEAFRLIEQYFGIESIEKIKKVAQEKE